MIFVMELESLLVAFVHWQAIPEIVSKPGALRPGFEFLADSGASYPPPNLPIVKPLGRVVPISSQARDSLDLTRKFWSMLQPRYPVQIVPSLGIRSSLPGIALSSLELRVLIHSFGLITTFSAEIKSESPIPGPALTELLAKLEQGQSLHCDCKAMKKCTNVRMLFKGVRDWLIPQMLTVTPVPIHRDASAFRPFCVLVLGDGKVPNTLAEIEQAPDERLQLHAALERAPASQGEVNDDVERYDFQTGRGQGTGVDTGWVLYSMNGVASYLRGTADKPAPMRTRLCHFHNLRNVSSLYRLSYSFLAAALLNPRVVPEQHMGYGSDIVRGFRKEYPWWGIRWSIPRLKAHEKVNNFVGESGRSSGSAYKIFVCYAHEDAGWLDKLSDMFAAPISAQLIELISDREIPPSAKWDVKIGGWLDSVRAAVLFVSPSFFKSEYIKDKELPALLKARDRVKIYWVLVEDTLYTDSPLGLIQSADFPVQAWAGLSPEAQTTKVRQLAEKILGDMRA